MKLFTRKLTLPLILLMASFQPLAATADEALIKETLETLRLAINAHDYKMLKPSLHEDFTYQGKDPFMSNMIMRQVVEGYPQEVNAIEVLSISPLDDGWDVKVILAGKEPSKQRQVTITGDYLIRQADIADIKLGGHG
jgi:hypothetical protein